MKSAPAELFTHYNGAIDHVLGEMSIEELEMVAVDVIREHRRRLQCAQDLFDQLELLDAAADNAIQPGALQHDYRVSLLHLSAQHQLVGAVVAALGYVPDGDACRRAD
jgi:hypothetical protein